MAARVCGFNLLTFWDWASKGSEFTCEMMSRACVGASGMWKGLAMLPAQSLNMKMLG